MPELPEVETVCRGLAPAMEAAAFEKVVKRRKDLRFPLPDDFEAESLLPAIVGEDWTPREHVYAEHPRDGILTDTDYMTMVRSREWKLVHFLDEPWGQLFNLVDDPDEVNNLWDDPSCADKKNELLNELREWRIRSAYRTSKWASAFR